MIAYSADLSGKNPRRPDNAAPEGFFRRHMHNRTLDHWLQHWLAQHPREIVMGLARVRRVWSALGALPIADRVFVVAGTNGKGSTVAFLDAMLRAAGYRVGRYTSPHLKRYNERVVVDGIEAGDVDLINAFQRIEHARGDTPLTYFEAGTLAALLIFAESALDVAVLEVGLGGRLDAVNLIDADVAVITSIALDHQELLGTTLDAIAAEKAGVCRRGRPVVIAMSDPPEGLLHSVAESGAQPLRAMIDYGWQHEPGRANWTVELPRRLITLPMPALQAPVQLRNAAAAIMALACCADRLPLDDGALRTGLQRALPPGRLQIIAAQPEVVLDVAHNPEAAQALADWLAIHPKSTRAVFSVLADKDAIGIVRVLKSRIAHWHLCGLSAQSPRGLQVGELSDRLLDAFPDLPVTLHAAPDEAFAAASALATTDSRVLVFGSFYLIGALLPEPHM
jgi:dihydrofolate synthase / folylpolyglutamate synthase